MDAFICDATRTPIGRYGGALSSVRTDDLAALPLAALKARNPQVDWASVDDVIYGDANQAGESNRNVARMAALLAGLPIDVPGTTVNRLCASGMDAVGMAARGIKAGDYDLAIAGGVESMSRAPFVMPKASSAFTQLSTLSSDFGFAGATKMNESINASSIGPCKLCFFRKPAFPVPSAQPFPRFSRCTLKDRSDAGRFETTDSPSTLTCN